MDKYTSVISKAQSIIKNSFIINSKIATYAIHSGHVAFEHPGTGHPVIPPISLSTTFRQKSPDCPLKYDYTSSGNYNREILEKTIAAMEDAKYCCAYSSGLATLSSITQMLKAGDHILFFNDVYGGTNRYFRKVATKFNIKCDAIDMQNIDLFRKSLLPNTRMVWLETPSNPLMRIVDIRAISQIAKEFNKEIIVVVDNTFLTPVFQLPLNLGADIVMHSLTKYLNGHTDVLMGAAAMNNEEIYKLLKKQQSMVEAVPSPFDCYLALRGLRTLVVRMTQHQLGGLAVALFLADHPKIEKVLHPAFFPSPEKEIIEKQMTGFCGMISAYVKGSPEDVITFMQNLKYFQIAESLGGYESLIEIPRQMFLKMLDNDLATENMKPRIPQVRKKSIFKAIQACGVHVNTVQAQEAAQTDDADFVQDRAKEKSLMTHASVPSDQRAELGISDNLVRISVGLEDIYSLLEDLDNGLAKIN